MGILSFIIGIGILIVVLKILMFPIKIMIKFIINSIIGGVILGILGYLGIIIVANWWLIILTGIFGVPGLIIAIIISLFI